LWGAITRADDGNLYRLRQGFPNEVDGYLAYTREPGWWPAVEAKLSMKGADAAAEIHSR
jgi:hypothetical protein